MRTRCAVSRVGRRELDRSHQVWLPRRMLKPLSFFARVVRRGVAHVYSLGRSVIRALNQANVRSSDTSVETRTVDDLIDTLWRERWRHQRSARQTESVLRIYLRTPWPAGLQGINVRELTRDKVREWHAGHHARPFSANRAIEMLSHAWRTVIPDAPNPCAGVRKYAEPERRRVLDDSECHRFIASLGALRQSREISEIASEIIWTLLATGARKTEITSLRADQVDLISGTIKLTRHKSDGVVVTKVVHLGAAHDVVKRRVMAALATGSPWVFPGRSRAGHFVDIEYAFHRVCAHARIVSTKDCVPHMLRKQFGTILVNLGEGLPIVGACMGHEDQKTTAKYARPGDRAKARAVARVAAEIGVTPWERKAA